MFRVTSVGSISNLESGPGSTVTDAAVPLHIDWLFRRHVRQEKFEDISNDHEVDSSTVKSEVKRLRSLLDLQPNSWVMCLDHQKRPGRLYSGSN